MKNIKNRDAQYLHRKLFEVDSVVRDEKGDISKMYCDITRNEGQVYEPGSSIDKYTLEFIRKGYKVAKKYMDLSPNVVPTNTITIECLEKVDITVEYDLSNNIRLNGSYNAATETVTITGTVNGSGGTLQGTEKIPFKVILTSNETNVIIGVIDCYVNYTHLSISPED